MIEFQMSKPKRGDALFVACVYIEESRINLDKKARIHPFAGFIYNPDVEQFDVLKAA
ncbi:MAG: hypothetical protein OEZ45_03815 [Candidatus Aminicenantes bacterium]|nr:hypothetical protein [Candidatus Aminicenantes bacterium]